MFGKPYAIHFVFILMFALILMWQYFFNFIDIVWQWRSNLAVACKTESVFVNVSGA
jgi:hypothetical protein